MAMASTVSSNHSADKKSLYLCGLQAHQKTSVDVPEPHHFPIQNPAKISPSRSSLVNCPVIVHRASWARRSSSANRSEEHTSELQSLMRISYAVFCLKKKNK